MSVAAHDPRLASRAAGLLRAFNEAGVLAAPDVHVASRLGALAGVGDEEVLLGVALAVRGPRLGHTRVDLSTIRSTAAVDAEEEVDVRALPWPESREWLRSLEASPLVAVGDEGRDGAPLRLCGSTLYLDRYWREERRVAADLASFAGDAAEVDADLLREGIARVFAGDAGSRQALAAATAVLRRLAIVAGGPGTGKTTTVARIAALLCEQAAARGGPLPLIALAAPTGKAAARLQEAVHAEAARLRVDDAVRGQLAELRASTLHRLLGWSPGTHSRFKHSRENRLPHDVVIVDETSMVALSMMARLVEAVRPSARLVLIGDPAQLASIEAGVVLGDVVGPGVDGLRLSAPARDRLASVVGSPVAAGDPPEGAAIADGVVVLDRVHRHGEEIGAVADAIRRGDADGTLAALSAGSGGRVRWIAADPAEGSAAALDPVRSAVVGAARETFGAARAGEAARALASMGAFRLLCAHRRGPHGVSAWTERVEGWLADDVDSLAGRDGGWYAGRPLLVTQNDYALRLYNGDTGVVVAVADGDLRAAFERAGDVVLVRPGRLAAIETVFAMTVHKSQGSQFTTTAVLLPPPASPLLTRELLYTAVTRAREAVMLVGEEASIRAAVERPAARASGLRERLWGG